MWSQYLNVTDGQMTCHCNTTLCIALCSKIQKLTQFVIMIGCFDQGCTAFWLQQIRSLAIFQKSSSGQIFSWDYCSVIQKQVLPKSRSEFEFLNPARSVSGRIWNSQIWYNPSFDILFLYGVALISEIICDLPVICTVVDDMNTLPCYFDCILYICIMHVK